MEPFKDRIARRIRTLREGRDLSLAELQRRTGDVLSKSRISNWEQATRMPGPDEATILAAALGTSAAHILCLDDGALILSPDEAKLIAAYRTLPLADQQSYLRRFTALALAYGQHVPDEAVESGGFAAPANRKKKAHR